MGLLIIQSEGRVIYRCVLVWNSGHSSI